MTKQTIQRYDIMIKDLVSGESEGFMLAPGKTGPSFSYSTLPPIVAKNQQGEITMGDLTNTSVFVQYNWSGQTDPSLGAIGPRGIKYWVPRYNYSQILPTSCYWRGDGVDTSVQEGELRLAYGVAPSTKLPDDELIASTCYDNEILYAGSAESGKVFSSSDNGITWNLLVDIAAETGQPVSAIPQLLIVKNKYVKKLGILAGTLAGYCRPFFWTLSDKYGFDLLKDMSEKYYDEETDFDQRYSDAPDYIDIGVVNNITKNFTSVASSFTGRVKISEIFGTNDLIVQIEETLDGTIEELKQVQSADFVNVETSAIGSALIFFKNFSGVPQNYETDTAYGKKIFTIPNNCIVIGRFSGLDFTKEYKIALYNRLQGGSTGVYPGMFTDDYGFVYNISGGDVYMTRTLASTAAVNLEMKSGGKVAILLDYHGGSLLGTKFEGFTVQQEFTNTKNIKELITNNGKNYYVSEKINPTIIVASDPTTDGRKNINRLQKITSFDGDIFPNISVCQLIKLGYDSTKSEKDQYLGVILYEPNSKIEYKVVPVQALCLTDNRMFTENIRSRSFEGEYYVSAAEGANYVVNNKHVIHGFEDDIPSHMAFTKFPELKDVPVSLGYDDIEDTTYFFTKKANGSETVTLWRAVKEGFQKELDFPGVGLAVGCRYANRRVFWASRDYGYVYRYMLRNGQVKYEKVYTGMEAGNEDSVILDGIIYEGYYMVVNNKDKVGYGLDILNDQFIEKFKIDALNGEAISLIQAGKSILIQGSDGQIFRHNKDLKHDKGFLISSIYGGMLGTVKKNCIQARMLVSNQLFVGDKGQRFRLAVSDDEGLSFQYLPRVLGMPLIPDDFENAVATEYEYKYDDILGDQKNECIFWFPYEYVPNKICYKVEMYRGTGELHEIMVSHIEIHFLLQSFKELVLNLAVNIFPKQKLLDASIEHTPNSQWIKMNFLRNIWENGNKVEITLPRGEKYYGVPFAIPNTGNDGFNIIAIDQQEAKKDLDNIGFMVSMVFKSIVQLTKKTF